MNQAAGRPLGSLLEEQPNGRDPLGAGEAIFAAARGFAEPESPAANRVAESGFSNVHTERAEVDGFSVVEAHGG